MKRRQRGADTIGLSILLVGAVIIVLSCIAMPSNRSPAPPSTPADEARGACILFIERAARNPGSVDHIDNSSWPVSQQSDDTFGVTALFRANNALGHPDVYTSTCIVKRTGNQWSLVKLQTRSQP